MAAKKVSRRKSSRARAPRILVATDFSDPARSAVEHAMDLAGRIGASVEIVTVVPEHKALFPSSPKNRKAVAAIAQAEIQSAQAALEELARGRRVPTRVRIASGLAHEEILAVAAKPRVDWIVVANRGQNLTERLLIGSTADRVLRKATVPVIVVPIRPGKATRGKRRKR